MKKDVGIAFGRGNRNCMEDSHFLLKEFGPKKDWIFGGVYDGHFGSSVANLASKKIPELFWKNLKKGMSEKKAFRKTYEEVCDPQKYLYSGCCALTFFIKGQSLYVANSGDCRLIMITQKMIFQITRDHRLSEKDEYERVEKSGGYIQKLGKISYACKGVEGLMVTRSLGDGYFGEIGIISEPEIFCRKIPKTQTAYIVAATDGLWDERDNEWVAEICRQGKEAKKTAEEILNKAAESSFTSTDDNITVIVVRMTP